MQVLPHGAAHRARNADIMFQPRESPLHRYLYQVPNHGARFSANTGRVRKPNVIGTVPNDEAAKPFVADENVGAETEDEEWTPDGPGGGDCPREVVGGRSIVQKVSGTTDLERGEWREWNVRSQTTCDERLTKEGDCGEHDE